MLLEIILALGGTCGLAPSTTNLNDISAFEIVVSHQKDPNKVQPATNVRPGLPAQLILSYVDCEFDYRCYCQQRFAYKLQQVDKKRGSFLLHELENLADSPMFGCYETGQDLRGKRETRCRFVRHLRITKGDQAFKEVPLPASLDSDLDLWVESVVRVDSRGLPLQETSSRAMPILVQSSENLYEVFQEFKPSGNNCMMEVHFSGKVFDLTSCRKDVSCLQKTLDLYTSEIRRLLSESPLEASEIRDQPIPPGQIWMRRAFEPSKVLGEPYFELTTYVLDLWFTAYDHGDYSMTPRPDLHSLYLNASESFTRSVGVSGNYTEPTQEQMMAYKAATNATLLLALENTCRAIRGHMEGSICRY